jgi:tetratricopeptide (TPR) repeat protein
VLGSVVQELKFQMREQKDNKEKLDAITAKFGDFLELLSKEVDPKEITDRQFVMFLGSSYASLKKHEVAVKLFKQVLPPKLDPNKKATEAEQREMQEYWAVQGLLASSLRQSKQFAECRKVLDKIIKDKTASGRFQAQKELNLLLEDEGEWGQAVTAWSDYMSNGTLKATIGDKNAKPADKEYALDLYFDGFYHYILCNFKYGKTHKDRDTHTQYIEKAASLIKGLESRKTDGWRLIGPKLMEMVRADPELAAAYSKAN